MNIKIKAFLYNFLGFAPIYFISYFFITKFDLLQGFWVPLASAILSVVFSPKFQVVTTQDGEKLYMKWIFKKGVQEIK